MSPSRILVIHNRYRQSGGEDHAFRQEADLLLARGHTVIEYIDTNDRFDDAHPVAESLRAVWSQESYRRIAAIVRDAQPEIAHFHNTFLKISPAAYYACQDAGVPVVQTLHNYRLGCVNGCCVRASSPCQTCMPSPFAWRAVVHGCYRNSRPASLAVAGLHAIHRAAGTYRSKVDAFISTSHFARTLHIRSGVPEDRCFVKPNFSADVAEVVRPPSPRGAPYALFVGRLCEEKGIHVALEAWAAYRLSMPLKVVGVGPSEAALREKYGANPAVEFIGSVPRQEVMRLMVAADFLVHPSLVFENCGLVVIEALSAGLPCVVSGHGSFAELVDHKVSGLHFRPGNAAELAASVMWMEHHPAERERMRLSARARFLSEFTAGRNYETLMGVYEYAAREHEAPAEGRAAAAIEARGIPA